ncbi:MAG: hypothetical protein QXH80_01070 [Candidatus Nanoarchaeia archaeon]
MREIAKLLNEMCEKGIIRTYAIFGAVAQMRYTEAIVTLDMDILVAMHETDSIAILSPIYQFCLQKGYYPEGEAIKIGDWPVQFIPAFDDLSTEALFNAEVANIEGEKVRVVKADYLAVMALKVGRAKDKTRILSLLESNAVTEEEISILAIKHNLSEKWEKFKQQFLNET